MTITFLWIFIVEISFRITIFNNVQNKWQTLNLRAWYLYTKASAYIWLAAGPFSAEKIIDLYAKAFTSIWKQLPLYESIDLHFIATTYIGNQRPIFRGIQGGGCAPRPPLRVPPLRGWGGASMGEALLILNLLAFPFLRSGTVVYLGGQ